MLRVTAAIIRQGGRILICQRRRDARFPLQWEFPGGKIEDGEAPEACLQRELREELGIEADIGPRVTLIQHVYPGTGEVELHFFRVDRFRGTPRNLGFEQIVWARTIDLPQYEFLEADRGLIQALSRGELADAP